MLLLTNIFLIVFYISLLIELLWFSVPSPASTLKVYKRTNRKLLRLTFAALGLMAYLFPLFYLISILLNKQFFEINTATFLLVTGFVLISAGRIITFLGGLQIKNHFNKKGAVLLDSGIFRISRHPIALGLIITLFGLNFILPSFIMMVLTVIFILDLHHKVLIEEEMLLQQYADAYKNYCKKTNRYL